MHGSMNIKKRYLNITTGGTYSNHRTLKSEDLPPALNPSPPVSGYFYILTLIKLSKFGVAQQIRERTQK